MADTNSFEKIMALLMSGAEGILTSKTVVGSAVRVGETILIPLSDVTVGAGAGSNSADRKDLGAGGFSAKMSPTAVLVIKGGNTKVVSIKDQNSLSRLIDLIPEVVDKVTAKKTAKEMMDDDDAVDSAFPDGTDPKDA